MHLILYTMSRLLSALVMMLIYVTIYSQQITREQVDSLKHAVVASKPDTGRLILLLRIAQFHLLTPGATPKDFDSASGLIKEAVLLNAKIKSKEYDGYITLVESCLKRRMGQREAGQQKVDEAIKIL